MVSLCLALTKKKKKLKKSGNIFIARSSTTRYPQGTKSSHSPQLSNCASESDKNTFKSNEFFHHLYDNVNFNIHFFNFETSDWHRF